MAAGDRLFGDMTRAEHAYALGLVASVGRIREGWLELPLRGEGRPLLELLRAQGPGDIPASYEVGDKVVRIAPPLSLLSARWLEAAPGERGQMRFPNLERTLGWALVRGLLDGAGHVSSARRSVLRVRLARPGARFLDGLLEFLPLAPERVGKRHLHWTGHNALDLLGHLYDDPALGWAPCREKNRARYLAWSQRVPPFGKLGPAAGALRWTRVHPDARAPFKERASDSGYDLTLLYEKKRVGRVVLYGTGLVVEPPYGWYLDVVPRSSIIKTGHVLANNVGVIDRGYRGEILVPLLKVDPAAPDLELPARVVQMVPRPIVHLALKHVAQSTASHRGSGGFGSTG